MLGKTLLLAGSILVVSAVFARAGLANANADRAQAGQPLLHAVGEAFPQYPTWLVPEGPLGFTIAGLLIVVGTALALLAEKPPRR